MGQVLCGVLVGSESIWATWIDQPPRSNRSCPPQQPASAISVASVSLRRAPPQTTFERRPNHLDALAGRRPSKVDQLNGSSTRSASRTLTRTLAWTRSRREFTRRGTGVLFGVGSHPGSGRTPGVVAGSVVCSRRRTWPYTGVRVAAGSVLVGSPRRRSNALPLRANGTATPYAVPGPLASADAGVLPKPESSELGAQPPGFGGVAARTPLRISISSSCSFLCPTSPCPSTEVVPLP